MSKKQDQTTLKVRKGIAVRASLLALALALGTNSMLQPSQIGITVPDGPEAPRLIVPDGPEATRLIVPDAPDASDPEW